MQHIKPQLMRRMKARTANWTNSILFGRFGLKSMWNAQNLTFHNRYEISRVFSHRCMNTLHLIFDVQGLSHKILLIYRWMHSGRTFTTWIAAKQIINESENCLKLVYDGYRWKPQKKEGGIAWEKGTEIKLSSEMLILFFSDASKLVGIELIERRH